MQLTGQTYDVVVGDRVDGVKVGEVVLEGSIVSVPCDNIEGSVILLGSKETATVLVDNTEGSGILVNKGSDGGLEVTAVGKTVGTNGTKVGKRPGSVEDLANVTTAIFMKHGSVGSVTALLFVVKVIRYQCVPIVLISSVKVPWAVREGDRVTDTALDNTDLVGVNQDLSKLGGDVQATLLGNYGPLK